jgi:hypothetical protein
VALPLHPDGAAARAWDDVLPNRSGLPWASGVRDTNPNSFVAYRERPIDVLLTFARKRTWAEIRAAGSYNYPSLLGSTAHNRQEAIVVSYPMFPLEQNPRDHGVGLWRRAANGEFDWQHDAAAVSFSGYSQKLVFRIGWEWNARSFFPWRCVDVALAPDYIAYFRRIVDRFRARVPDCAIDWCATKKGHTNASIDRWYPGGDWVAYIGHDKYDWWIAIRTQAEWDKDYGATYLGGPKGIGAWLGYARSKGKRLCLSEWALVSGDPAGGGDNPFYVRKMHEFFGLNAGDMGYECYFNANTDWTHRLQDHPAAGQEYRARY